MALNPQHDSKPRFESIGISATCAVPHGCSYLLYSFTACCCHKAILVKFCSKPTSPLEAPYLLHDDQQRLEGVTLVALARIEEPSTCSHMCSCFWCVSMRISIRACRVGFSSEAINMAVTRSRRSGYLMHRLYHRKHILKQQPVPFLLDECKMCGHAHLQWRPWPPLFVLLDPAACLQHCQLCCRSAVRSAWASCPVC